ncbi:MAG: hypothetical protein K2X01_11440 [Cyanobacteria bacterium]|nr:hypothetical protein [Cyanobacteriota bacterium]
MSNPYPNQFPFYQRTFSQEHPYMAGLARMFGAAGSGQGMITGGMKSAMEGYAQDQELARQRAMQLYQMQERARMAQSAGLPVNDYTTLPVDELKTFGEMQGNYNVGQIYQDAYEGRVPQMAGKVFNYQAVSPLVQEAQKEQFKQYQNQRNAQNLPYALNAIQGQPIPQGAAFPENMATSILQNYTTRQNNQDRLNQQQPLVDSRVQNTQSGTQLNNARTKKTQVDTQLAPLKASHSGGGRGRPKATYDPAAVQGILDKIQDPAQKAYWSEYYRRKGSLPVSVVNPKGGNSGSLADKIKQIKGGASGASGGNPNEARRKSLGIEY